MDLNLMLQFFADEGNGNAVGENTASESGVTESVQEAESVDNTESAESLNIPSSIPERARGIYQRALQKKAGTAVNKQKQIDTAKSEERNTESANGNKQIEAVDLDTEYNELIKGKYKAQHDAYMQRTMGSRFKRIDSDRKKTDFFLKKIAKDYGVDPDSDNLVDEIEKAYAVNDDKVRQYAEEHDMPENEARDILTMREQLQQKQREDQIREQAEKELAEEQKRNEAIDSLRQSAEKTKQLYPQFDLKTEMQDEMFRKMCAVSNGDTTFAYKAIHHDELIASEISRAAKTAQKQASQAVSSNLSRPVENGLSSSAPSVSEINFRNMNLKEIRAFADKMRRG